MHGNVIPKEVVAAYRARRAMLAATPITQPEDGFRHIADVVRDVILTRADAVIENWQRRSHG